jgi:preprotein translocase subunit SecD
LTSRLSVLTVGKEGSELPKDDWYLNETLDLFLDDQHVDTLNIGSDLRGRDVSDIAISGWGSGTVQQDALFNALENMKRLQTILITGSLPVKLEMVKVDTISPFLGEEFLTNSVLVGILALAAVSFIVLARYRKIVISIPIIFMSVSEVVLLLGLAALIGWNIDVAAIAGIIIAVGTGVNDQIVITDETLRRESQAYLNLRQKIKNAFFIVVSAYATIMVAMLPLLFAGAGLLKGFAITTMIGLSFGVLITRPAYAAIAEILLQE